MMDTYYSFQVRMPFMMNFRKTYIIGYEIKGFLLRKRYGSVIRISSFREPCNEILLDSVKCHCDRIINDYNSNLD